jgi:hypothetical protein
MSAWAAELVLAVVLAAPFFVIHHDARLMRLVLILWPLLVLAAGLTAAGALFRLGVAASVSDARRLGLGPGGLQFGRPELRILGAGAIVSLFLGLVAIALAVAGAFLFNASGLADLEIGGLVERARAGEAGAAVMAVFLALAAWILVQLSVRLSLFKPATVARGRMVSLDAMALAQGNLWRLAAGLVVVMIPSLALAALCCGPIGADAPSIANLSPARVWAVIDALGLAFVQAPLAAGFLSEAYKRLEYWTG